MADPAELRAQLEQWQFEYALIDTLLRQIEQEERNGLTACGVDPPTAIGADDFLRGDAGAGASREQRTRVREAMITLALITQTRSHLALGHGNPSRAAHTALLVGLHANEATARAVLRTLLQQRSRKGGTARGRAVASKAAKRDAKILEHYRKYLSSDDLQSRYPAATAYIVKKTGFKPRTVQRRLKLLKRQ